MLCESNKTQSPSTYRQKSIHDLVLIVVPFLKFQAHLRPEEIEATTLPSPMGGCTLHKVRDFVMFQISNLLENRASEIS